MDPVIASTGAPIRNRIRGGQSCLERLDQLRSLGRIPHALCIAGSDMNESKLVALAFAQDLLCEKINQEAVSACGHCGPCLRIHNVQSESVLLVAPEKDQLKISDTRAIMDYLSRASDAKAQVVIIENAQLLNKSAANAFLKTLEEPSKHVIFVLLVFDHNSLLPTIRSRVQVITQQAGTWMAIQELRAQKFLSSDALAKSGMTEDGALDYFKDFWLDEHFLDRSDWKEVFKDRTKSSELLKSWILIGLDHTAGRKIVSDLASIESKRFRSLLNELIQIESGPKTNEDSILNLESIWIRHVSNSLQSMENGAPHV